MADNRNENQIIRKDSKNCFVESLKDAFEIGKIHLGFAAYDMSRPVGQRQTDSVHIYISVGEFLELCRKLNCGELRYLMQNKKKNHDNSPLYQCLGGTSADKLEEYKRPRKDGMSLSRTAKLICGNQFDFLFIADSGPGVKDENGLIVPKFGKKPENHVSVSMTWDTLSEFLLTTEAHYKAWLSAWYTRNNTAGRTTQSNWGQSVPQPQNENYEPQYTADPLF